MLQEDIPGAHFLPTHEPGRFAEKMYSVTGYPGDVDQRRFMYTMDGAVHNYKGILRYKIDTYSSQSGSPIWRCDGYTPLCIGVHTSGANQYNMGVHFESEIIDYLRKEGEFLSHSF